MADLLIANEEQLQRILIGFEAVPGTAVAPDDRWYGQITIDEAKPLVSRPSWNGTHFGDTHAIQGPIEVGGSFSGLVTYEHGPAFLRALVRSGAAGVGDAGTPEAFTHTKRPLGTANAVETATVQHGFAEMPRQTEMLWFTEGTIRADIDAAEAAWMFDARLVARISDFVNAHHGTATGGTATTLVQTGAGWTVDEYAGGVVWLRTGTGVGGVRSVVSNTADTLTVAAWDVNPAAGTTFTIIDVFQTGVADTDTEAVESPGTSIYIDPHTGGTIGTTPIDVHVMPISFSVTYRNNTQTKRGLSNVNAASTKRGHGLVQVSGQIRVEDESPYFDYAWKNKLAQLLRFEQEGSIVHDAVAKRARIDVFEAYFDTPTRDTRGTNLTKTWPFVGYADIGGEAAPIEYEFVNEIETLP